MKNTLYVLLAISFFVLSCSPKKELPIAEIFDWQGHRGARGLAPENSLPGFLAAIQYPLQTLELDCVISKDSAVVVSHEPWLSSVICLLPDGTPITKEKEDSLIIWQMTYAEIQSFDCGKTRNPNFPEQNTQPAYKPLLSEVVNRLKEHCKSKKIRFPNFNIEIKSNPEWDNIKTPEPELFARLVLSQVKALGIKRKTCIQSFDVRSLKAIKAMDDEVTLSFLVSNEKSIEENLAELGFQPEIYSPNYALVTPELVTKAHQIGIQVIPWTVNEQEDMKKLIEMGVDGIITDYPNRML